MKEIITKCLLSDLCHVVGVKSYTLPVLESGKVKGTLYVQNKYEIGYPLASFTTEQKEKGYYLLSEHIPDLLYCSFILNSGLGMLSMHEEGDSSYTKGTVTKKKLENVTINQIPEKYKRACNYLEMIIIRVSRLKVEGESAIIRDATVSFLNDMRSSIGLEIYMNAIFESRHVSVLEPWAAYVEENGGAYRLKQVDDVFLSFYKSISDPDNEIMDAMKKARLFVWELGKSIKKD